MISRIDVEDVGVAIGLIPTQKAVDYVLKNYKSAQKIDPSATWDLVVDQLLNEYYSNIEKYPTTPCQAYYMEQIREEDEFNIYD
jgi:hypothetical protein